ncbi:unnamed protein product [Lymnaea stagnalis]|uniref:G patch domain-containing protein 11 n=1 Tax=Lymnaea stagnalis TaxID=6523 RepID=A0AAV2H6V7_LYMST
MSSEEEDYMSDTFLLKCGDTRPGLAPKQIQKKYEKEKLHKETAKKNAPIPKRQLEALHRETGLSSTISSESKGYAMLQKMGYKPGMGIGKLGTGRTEPVPIELKTGRSGLGRDTEMKRKATEMNNMRAVMAVKRRKAAEKDKETFMGRMSERFNERNVWRDLNTAQKACLQLDQEQGISEPGEPFFWPAVSLQTEEEDKTGEEEDTEKDKLQDYINDVNAKHPDVEDEIDKDEVIECPTYLEFSESERLEIVTRYLRNTYFYCLWCGTKYDDKQDLESHCPGNSNEAHE